MSRRQAPYDLFAGEFGKDAAALFGISRVAANDVTLRPFLLGVEVRDRESVSTAGKNAPDK